MYITWVFDFEMYIVAADNAGVIVNPKGEMKGMTHSPDENAHSPSLLILQGYEVRLLLLLQVLQSQVPSERSVRIYGLGSQVQPMLSFSVRLLEFHSS